MKKLTQAAWLLLTAPLLLGACKKTDDTNSLEGPRPTSDFSFQANATQFPTVVTFTTTGQDGFVYQWNFGDNSSGYGATTTHTYPKGGTYQAELITGGRGGTGVSAQKAITVPDACANTTFARLVNCPGGGIQVWTFSRAAGAIIRQDANGNQLSATPANGLPECQAASQFTFGSGFTYAYSASAATCGPVVAGTASFVFRPNAGGTPQLILSNDQAIIGTTTAATNRTYDILEITDALLRLRSTQADGTRTIVTLVPFDATAEVKRLLTGGSSKTWMLDNTADAPIIVGTEAVPNTYFGGVGPGQLPACQSDDEFTFSTSNVYTYNAKAETFSANGYSCQAPQSGTSPFTFGPSAGAGRAQFVLTRAGAFIGATDASPTERVYRILEIDNQKMLLRAGSGANGGTVFTFKLVAKP